MADSKELRQAKAVYQTICEALTGMEWDFERDEEKLIITTGVQGDDLPMKIAMRVDVERQFVNLLSYIPFSIPEEKRVEMSVALHIINYRLANGSFDYNFADGEVLFRMTTSFMGSLLGKETFEYMLFVACNTVDEYNDKILMMCKNKMTLEELIDSMNE